MFHGLKNQKMFLRPALEIQNFLFFSKRRKQPDDDRKMDTELESDCYSSGMKFKWRHSSNHSEETVEKVIPFKASVSLFQEYFRKRRVKFWILKKFWKNFEKNLKKFWKNLKKFWKNFKKFWKNFEKIFWRETLFEVSTVFETLFLGKALFEGQNHQCTQSHSNRRHFSKSNNQLCCSSRNCFNLPSGLVSFKGIHRAPLISPPPPPIKSLTSHFFLKSSANQIPDGWQEWQVLLQINWCWNWRPRKLMAVICRESSDK